MDIVIHFICVYSHVFTKGTFMNTHMYVLWKREPQLEECAPVYSQTLTLWAAGTGGHIFTRKDMVPKMKYSVGLISAKVVQCPWVGSEFSASWNFPIPLKRNSTTIIKSYTFRKKYLYDSICRFLSQVHSYKQLVTPQVVA